MHSSHGSSRGRVVRYRGRNEGWQYGHEFGHYLGLPDLYDTSALESIEPEDESAGIGYWGSWGMEIAVGTSAADPTFSSWSLAQLGWLGLETTSSRREATGESYLTM